METVQLQGIGKVKAIKSEDLKVGMVRYCNYGITEEIVAIAPKGKQSLSITVRGSKGRLWTFTSRRSTLVAAR